MKVSIANLTFKQYVEFTEAMKSSDLERAGVLASNMVDTDFTELDFDVAIPTLKTIGETLNGFFSEVDTKPVTVDLKGWKWKDFAKFQKLVSNGHLVEALNSVRSLVLIDAQPIESDPTFQEGIMAIKAVSDKVGKVFAGKN